MIREMIKGKNGEGDGETFTVGHKVVHYWMIDSDDVLQMLKQALSPQCTCTTCFGMSITISRSTTEASSSKGIDVSEYLKLSHNKLFHFKNHPLIHAKLPPSNNIVDTATSCFLLSTCPHFLNPQQKSPQ